MKFCRARRAWPRIPRRSPRRAPQPRRTMRPVPRAIVTAGSDGPRPTRQEHDHGHHAEDDPEGYQALSYGMYDGQKALSEILSTINWTDLSPTSENDALFIEETENIISMALSNGRVMLAFFLHANHEFSRAEVRPSVTFRSLQEASYQVTWYDPRTGSADVPLTTPRAPGDLQ